MRPAAGIDETIELQKAHGGGPEFSRPLGSAIVACVCAGAFDRVRAISEEVMPLALATGDAGTVAQTSLFGGMVDTAEGHFAEARTRMNGAVKIYHDTGMPWESAALAAAVGPVILMGDWETARIDSERAVDLLRDKTVTTYYPVLIERIAGIAALCGDRFDLAEEHFDAALQQAEALPFVSEQGEIRAWRALMLLRRNAPGDQGRARKFLQEAGSEYSRHGMPKHRGMTEKILENL